MNLNVAEKVGISMGNDLREILDMLSINKYCTAYEIGQKLQLSSRTIRTRIKELGAIAEQYNIRIISKPRYGFKLECDDEKNIEYCRAALINSSGLPDSNSERTDYLLAYLLNHRDYTKIDDLSDFLCVSRSTLQISLKSAGEILDLYNLTISRKPGYGICVEGHEFDLRRCVGECFIKRNMLDKTQKVYSREELEELGVRVLQIAEKNEVHIQETAFENLIIQIYVSLKRIKRGCYLPDTEKIYCSSQKNEHKAAIEISKMLEEAYEVRYNDLEIAYIEIYLAGNRIYGDTDGAAENFVIKEELDLLVVKMLELIYEEYGVDLRKDFNLRIALNMHMVSFDIRMRYHMKLTNPILGKIRENYEWIFRMAAYGSKILEQHYQKTISEDEQGYFAMLLLTSIEQEELKSPHKINILIVCGAGRGSSMLLKYRYREEFDRYLQDIYTCSRHELANFNFDKVDFVFTTVPLYVTIPVPVIETGQFLDNSDITRIRNVLQKRRGDFLDQYFKPEYMFVDLKGGDRETVIRNMCCEIEKIQRLPDGFYESVLRREYTAHTDFGNKIAMPHPDRIMTDTTIVAIGILEDKIIWDKFPVQFVCLVSIGKREDKNLKMFYQIITNLFLREDDIESIIEKKNFETLMKILEGIYYEEE